MSKTTEPAHPGEILRKDFLEPTGLSGNALAEAVGVPPSRIGDILLKRRGVTADTALRFARYFGGNPRDWLLLQLEYDLRAAETTAGKEIERVVTPRATPIKRNDDRARR